MKKQIFKAILLGSSFVITACGSLFGTNNSSTPQYKMSDDEIKKWVIERNKIEQCLYPRDIRATRSSLSEEQDFLYHMTVYSRTLYQVIGPIRYNTLMNDLASQQYLATRLGQFDHTKQMYFDKKWCDDLKKVYSQAIKQTKATIKKEQSIAKAKQEQEKKLQAEKENRIRKEAYRKGVEATQQEAQQQQQGKETQPKIHLNRTKISWEPATHDNYSF
ncbi:DUF5358 family protein [Glaesserella sp.]|uniref:DUF5358 family protein n=1 Tax=Glaesserella sp. TaxID=2094731 RepID=UPI00359F9E40